MRIVERIPGQDQAAESMQTSKAMQSVSQVGTASHTDATAGNQTQAVSPAGQAQTVLTSQTVSAMSGDWPRFRGPNLDNVSAEKTHLGSSWPSGGPPMYWSLDLGEGYAGAAVHNSRVYVLDFDRQAQADVLRCIAFADGKELWRCTYPDAAKRNHGISRTIPAVTDKYVVTIGPNCMVLCANAVTGQVLWQIDLVKEYHTEVPPWYAGQCPLIDGGKAVIAPGGSSLMIAVDCATGKVLWKTPNAINWAMTHSSIVPMTFKGRKMYVYCGSGGVTGISAKDGSILWQTNEWTVKIANVPTPVVIGSDELFLTGGYNSGSMMLQLTDQGGKIVPKSLFRLQPSVFGSDQQTPIFYKGYIYGVIPGGQLACLDLNGHQIWTSGNTHKFGLGPYLIADGKIFVMDDNGDLTVAEATPSGFHPLSQCRLLSGHDSWGPMALTGGRLIARDFTRMVCVGLANKK
jgi:outer membrane protein assembly factor BamB